MTVEGKFKLTQTYSFEKGSVSLTNNGMYYVHIDSEVEITLIVLKKILNAMRNLQSEKKLPTIVDIEVFSMPTKEAREFLAKEASSPFASAEAYLIKNTAQKILGNFYLKVNKPQRPTKLFTDFNKAITWLEEFK